MNSQGKLTRRQFLLTTCVTGGGAGIWLRASAAARPGDASPFAYDVERFEKSDPKLVRYDEVTRFTCPHPGPKRICLDGENRVYVAGGNHVSVLTPEGAAVRDHELSDKARSVACAADGTLYVGLREHVEVFDTDGRRLAQWETAGSKAWFTGMVASKEGLFVADAGNRVVLRCDRSGKVLGRLGAKNKEQNVPGLIVPSPYLDVDFGKDGLLRVNNPGRHRVELYTPEGELELSWGRAGAGVDAFCGCCNPVALAMLPDGRCVTCEKGLPRVKVYAADGKFESVVCGPEMFPKNGQAGSARDTSDGTMGGLDATVDSRGRVYVLDLVTAEVHVMARKADAA
jgi:hypothetical protein